MHNSRTGALVKTYGGVGAKEIRALACASSNDAVVTAGGDREIALWDVATGVATRKWVGHVGGANAVAFAARGGAVVVTGGDDASVKMWDTRSWNAQAVQSLDARSGVAFADAVTSIAIDDERARASCASVDGSVRTIDIRRGACDVDEIGAAVTCVRLSGDRKCALVGCLTSRVGLIDVANGDGLATYRGHVAETVKTECCFTNDDAYVIAGSEDGRVVVWDLVTSSVVSEFQAHGERSAVCAVDYSPRQGDARLVTSGADGYAHVWVLE